MRAPMTDRAGARMRRRRAEVRRPARRRHLRGEPFELAAADVLEVLARRIAPTPPRTGRPARRTARATSRADVLRQRHAVGHRHALDRDERHDVDRAEARMLARVRAQIDARRPRARTARGPPPSTRRGVAGEREHRAVVRRVGRVVEQPHAGRRRGSRRRCAATTSGAASFADVGNAFDQHTRVDSIASGLYFRRPSCYNPADPEPI